MKWKNFFDTYFLMSKRERNGIIVLLIIILFLIVVRLFLPLLVQHPERENSDMKHRMAQLERMLDSIESNNQKNYVPRERKENYAKGNEASTRTVKKETKEIQLFDFDPNTVGVEEMRLLGFSDRNIATIQNYRNKGGKFRQETDLFTIYGVDSLLVVQLLPYIHISGKEENKKEIAKIELNSADTTALKSLPGIGSVLARRICDYRDALGGFYSLSQLNEVYKLAPETVEKILPYLEIDASSVKRININFASIDELKKHPYLNYQQSKKIVTIRAQNGPFQTIDFLSADTLFNDNEQKLKAYLSVQ